MRPKIVVTAVIASMIAATVPPVKALYEDEAGKYDWEIKTVWGSKSKDLVDVFVSTKKTLVFSQTSFGSIMTKTGVTSKERKKEKYIIYTYQTFPQPYIYIFNVCSYLDWKENIPNNEKLTRVIHRHHSFVTGTSTTDKSNGHISYWEADGTHIWSAAFKNDEVTDLAYADYGEGSEAATAIVASFAAGTISAFSSKKGKLLWTYAPSEAPTAPFVFLSTAPSGLITAANAAGHRVVLNPKTGEAEKTETFSDVLCDAANAPLSPLGSADASDTSVPHGCISTTNDCATLIVFTATSAPTHISLDACTSAAAIHRGVIERCGRHYILTAQNDALVAVPTNNDSDSSITAAKAKVKVSSTSGFTVIVHNDRTELFTAVNNNNKAVICTDVSLAQNGRPLGVYSSAAVAVAVVAMEDRSLHGIDTHTGRRLWVREEALAAVTAAEFVGLPLPDASEIAGLRGEYEEEARGSIPERFITRVKAEALRISAKACDFWAAARRAASARSLDELLIAFKMEEKDNKEKESKEGDRLVADAFGFDQLAVLSTAPGKLFGMHTAGHIQWRTYLSGQQADVERLHVLRGSSDERSPVLALVRVFKTSSPQRTEVVRINGHTGAILSREEAPFAAAQSGLLQGERDPSTGEALLVLIERDSDADQMNSVRIAVHIFPHNSNSAGISNTTAQRAHFFLVDKVRNVISGYAPVHDAANLTEEEKKKNKKNKKKKTIAFDAVATWELPLEGERIVAVAGHHPREVVHSAATIFGNRTIRAKYLNPNLLAIATESITTSGLTVRVIDTASGATVATVSHKAPAGGPVRMAVVENSVVYHFWWMGQFRLGVIDLFEASTDWHRPSQRPAAAVYSAVQAYQQTYNFPHSVSSIALLPTAHGSASKFLLLALENGQVYALDKRFVDTRRPAGLDEKADRDLLMSYRDLGVFPYHPRVPLYTRNVVSYSRRIADVRMLVTAPTALESTSLALAVGEDIFFTRVAPLGSFDILSSNFNSELLVLTVLVLSVVTLVLKKMKTSKAVSRYWN